MKIETRFGIGDIVYLMFANKPRASKVKGVEIYIDAQGESLISYKLECFSISYKEWELAETRDELQKKVFGI